MDRSTTLLDLDRIQNLSVKREETLAAIVEAITARDQTAAEQLMRKHIRSAYHERLNLLFKG